MTGALVDVLLVGARVRTVVTGAGVLRGKSDESSALTVVDVVTVVSGGLEAGLLPDGRLPGELFTTSGLLFVLGLTLRLRVTVTTGTKESAGEVAGVTLVVLGALVVLVKGVVGLK